MAAEATARYGKALHVRWLTLVSPAMVTPEPSPFWNAVQEGKFEEWLIPDTLDGTRKMVMNVTNMTEEQSRYKKNKLLFKG